MPSSDNTPARATGRRTAFLLAAALALLVGAVYSPIWHAQFLNYDDTTQVVVNEHVNTGLSWANVTWAFTRPYASNYVPLTWLSHMVACQLFGMVAGWHHLLNVVLHILNTVLFFFLARRATGSLWPAFIAAGLFGLHPIHVESVAWVAERKDVLSTLFWLLACHAYFAYAASGGRMVPEEERGHSCPQQLWVGKPSTHLQPCSRSEVAADRNVRAPSRGCRRSYALLLVWFALGLLAKPMLVTLPFVLLLFDFWPLRRMPLSVSEREEKIPLRNASPATNSPRRTWSRLIPEKLPLLGLSAIACVVTFLSQHSGGAVTTFSRYPFGMRLANAAIAYVTYLGKLFVPVGFPVFVPLQARTLVSGPVLGAVLLLVLLTAAACSQAQRRPWLAVGWLWYLGTMVPVIGIIQVGAQSLAYRYAYIPFLGLYLAFAATLAEVLVRRRVRGGLVSVVGTVVLLGLSVLTWQQVKNWRDNETAFRYALKHTTRNWLALSNLGVHLASEKRYGEAIGYLQQALAIDPTYFQAANSLGFSLEHAGRPAEAVEAYRRAVAIRPQDPTTYDNLITVLVSQKRFPEALEVADRLLALDGGRARSHISRGSVLLAQGRADEATTAFQRALELDSASDLALYYLGMAYQQAGQNQKAVETFDRPLKLDEVQRLNRLITLSAALRDLQEYEQAAQVLRQGLRESPNSVELLEPLARLEYTYLKDQPNALAHLQLILKLDPNHPQREQYTAVIKYLSTQLARPVAGTNGSANER